MAETQLSLNDALQLAAKQYEAGNSSGTTYLCQQILAVEPRQADAMHLLGLLAERAGDLASAIEHVRRAISIDPKFVAAHFSLGRMYEAVRDLPNAIDCFRQVTLLDPTDAVAWHALGIALRKSRKNAQAINAFQKAIAIDPKYAEPHNELGIALMEAGHVDLAKTEFIRAVEIDPKNPLFQISVSNWFQRQGMPAAATFGYSETIKQFPGCAAAYSARAAALTEHKLYAEALLDHRKAVELAPLDAKVHLEMSKALSAIGDIEGAEACCRRALELDPNSPYAWECLGTAMQTNGRFPEAAIAFQKSLDMQPDAFVAMAFGAMIQRADRDDIERATTMRDDPKLSPYEKVSAGFALGKMLDEAERYDDAFAAYAQANALCKKLSEDHGQRFDIGELREKVDAAIDTFTPDFFRERSGWGEPSQLPVFIVGMPRSGTSLVEQIASSHSKVFGAGERFDVSMLHSRLASTERGDSPQSWTRPEIAAEAQSHLRNLARLGASAERVIDKMPGNLIDLGLIAMLFPQARIIICERDARDTCLSCYFQQFAKHHVLFSYDLADCGRQFNEYERLTAHWRTAFPLRMLCMNYEELVADLQGQSRRLIDFLNLPWEPACLRFHENQRPVLTRSVWQVRQPIFTRSVGRWKHYEKHLAPLLGVLDEK